MKEFYQAKFNELFVEFTRYIHNHPEFTEKFPQGSEVVLLDHRDGGYNRYVLAKTPKDLEIIVFVDVGELAPVRSRLKRPKIVAHPRIAV